MGISDYTRLQHSLLSPPKTGINILNETVPAYWVAWQKNKQTFKLNSNQTYGSQLSADGNKWTYPSPGSVGAQLLNYACKNAKKI